MKTPDRKPRLAWCGELASNPAVLEVQTCSAFLISGGRWQDVDGRVEWLSAAADGSWAKNKNPIRSPDRGTPRDAANADRAPDDL